MNPKNIDLATKIYFYDTATEKAKAEHIFLNNFAESPITIDGILYKTVEHYYQALSFFSLQEQRD